MVLLVDSYVAYVWAYALLGDARPVSDLCCLACLVYGLVGLAFGGLAVLSGDVYGHGLQSLTCVWSCARSVWALALGMVCVVVFGVMVWLVCVSIAWDGWRL